MEPHTTETASSPSPRHRSFSLYARDSGIPAESNAGAGFAVVFLHYFGGSSREWLETITHFSGRFRCIAPDLRGHGDSPDIAGAHSVDDMAGDVRELLQSMGVQSCVLVGHSMGGKIALVLAADSGENLTVERLLLLAPSPPSGQAMTENEKRKTNDSWGKRDAMVKMLDTAAVLPVAPDLRERFVDDNMRVTKSAWDAWQNTGSQEDISARVAGIAIPVEVLAGEHDPIIAPDVQAHDTVARLPDAWLKIVPGAGHLLPFEAGQAVVDALQTLTTELIEIELRREN